MSDFLQDKIINMLNGYYLKLYANDKKKAAFCMAIINRGFVTLMTFIGLIPARIGLKTSLL